MASTISSTSVINKLKKIASKEKRVILQRFFKTGVGQYGEGDLFLGVTVPQQRALAKEFIQLPLNEVEKMLASKYHEVRLTGLLILVLKYQKAELEKEKKAIFDFYIKHLLAVNNWDLVDVTTPNIVGDYLFKKPKNILYKLAKSKNLWQRRVSMLASFAFIKNHDFVDALKLAKIHLKDGHDLMHKAVGWMLREIGKRNVNVLRKFLDDNISNLARTTLRYAIEHFSEQERKKYLQLK